MGKLVMRLWLLRYNSTLWLVLSLLTIGLLIYAWQLHQIKMKVQRIQEYTSDMAVLNDKLHNFEHHQDNVGTRIFKVRNFLNTHKKELSKLDNQELSI